jgi:hypothetical protein
MKRLLLLILLASGLMSGARADVEVNVSQAPAIGMKGLHINRPADEPYATGILWDWEGNPGWGTGLDITRDYPGTPDLVLAYSGDLRADNLRMRADDARTNLGPRVGHPVMPFQFSVVAGTPEAHLGGIAIGTYGYQYSLYMFNRDSRIKRTHLNFQNLFGWYTDSKQNGTGDLTLQNFQTGSTVLAVSPANDLSVRSPRLGFFGASCVSKPTVAGSWSDGSAAKSLLSALVQLGLVNDATTP